MRRAWSSPTSRTSPPHLDPTAPPGDFDDGLPTEPAIVRKGYGDVDAAFASAHLVVDLTLVVGRHSGSPLETRGAIARLHPETGVLEIHGAAKIPHINRKGLAALLGLPLEKLHLYEGHVGGGFGIRGEIYPEDVLAALGALRLGRPVKWIEDRREHLIAANHSRDQVHHIRAAVDARGFILALDDEFFADQGAYVRTHAATVPDLTAAMLPGPYVIPAYRVAGHIRLTNKTPCGTYRAPGRYEGTFVRERLIDEIARRLGKDPVEVRRVNLIPQAEMPFHRSLDALGTEVSLDSGDYEGLLDKTLRLVRYDALREEIAAAAGGGRAGRLRHGLLRREERPRPVRRRPHHRRGRRPRRGGDRRGLDRAGDRDGDRPGLRRRARRAARRRSASSTARPTASATAWAPSPRAPR